MRTIVLSLALAFVFQIAIAEDAPVPTAPVTAPTTATPPVAAPVVTPTTTVQPVAVVPVAPSPTTTTPPCTCPPVATATATQPMYDEKTRVGLIQVTRSGANVYLNGNLIGDTYIVGRGDEFWKIASAFGYSIDELAYLNNLNTPEYIEIGDKIKIRGIVQPKNNTYVDQPRMYSSRMKAKSRFKAKSKRRVSIKKNS